MIYLIAILLMLSVACDGFADGFYTRGIKPDRQLCKAIHLICLSIAFFIKGIIIAEYPVYEITHQLFSMFLGYAFLRFSIFDLCWNTSNDQESLFYRGVKGWYAKFLQAQPIWMIIVIKIMSFLGSLVLLNIIF